ncbi:hypothetical protein ASPZODRAFT_128913, partial [Penicilliopsis zonata CBS 506.65]
MKWSVSNPDSTEAQTAAWLTRFNNETCFGYAVIRTDKLIGTIGLRREAEKEEKTAGKEEEWELGYLFRSDEWGQGYATEAVQAFLAYFLTQPVIYRAGVIAQVDRGNVASLRVLERVGF